MKKLLSLAVSGLVLLSSCVKGFDGTEPEPSPTPDPTLSSGVTDEDIQANVQKVFGTTFSDNQDWNSTTNGIVTFNISSDVKKVAIIAQVTLIDDEVIFIPQ